MSYLIKMMKIRQRFETLYYLQSPSPYSVDRDFLSICLVIHLFKCLTEINLNYLVRYV